MVPALRGAKLLIILYNRHSLYTYYLRVHLRARQQRECQGNFYPQDARKETNQEAHTRDHDGILRFGKGKDSLCSAWCRDMIKEPPSKGDPQNCPQMQKPTLTHSETIAKQSFFLGVPRCHSLQSKFQNGYGSSVLSQTCGGWRQFF